MDRQKLLEYLEENYDRYNRREFIANDPISVPHRFSKNQDIEIAGLIAAIFAWGQRKTIISKANSFLECMDGSPHDFVLNHSKDDLKAFTRFVHRTFNATDALWVLHFLRHHFQKYDSLEPLFVFDNMEEGLINFHHTFFGLPDAPNRTRKHIPTPLRKSSCKRLNMYLRWMVRSDDRGVDFGIWQSIHPGKLICPIDVHAGRIARGLGLLKRKQTDWQAAQELTQSLRRFDPDDPVKYDFALFGLGINDPNI
jgi:uncharacterized protein (TIGR02757 family)